MIFSEFSPQKTRRKHGAAAPLSAGFFDVSAFTGNWPFWKLGQPNMSQLEYAHTRNGVTGGVVSRLDSIFYNDPAEGDEELAAELPAGYLLALSHNPVLPYAREEIRENRLGAAELRLYPSYHPYRLTDPCCISCCREAARAGLVIHIVAKINDIRLDYLWRQQMPAADEIVQLARTVEEGSFILSGFTLSELAGHASKFAPLNNLFLDMAYSGDLLFGYEKIPALFPIERLVFGTYFPILCMESSTMALEMAGLSDDDKDMIGYQNAARLFILT
ncbi:MAG: hypothetical protein LBS62_06425 [Clostridiales bacterium]|jgi:hypothetical protein|nr:hypothetical protein [Clostridiales bacterium]